MASITATMSSSESGVLDASTTATVCADAALSIGVGDGGGTAAVAGGLDASWGELASALSWLQAAATSMTEVSTPHVASLEVSMGFLLPRLDASRLDPGANVVRTRERGNSGGAAPVATWVKTPERNVTRG